MSELVRIAEHLMQANIYGAVVYCTLMGKCKVESASIEDNRFMARLVQERDFKKCLECDEYGRPAGDIDAECCVFPSRDNRDWNTFDATPRYDISELKPFDKVLRRSVHKEAWAIDFFSHYNYEKKCFVCHYYGWEECVPYNDETKHLLGTTDEAPNFYKTWKSDNKDSE